MPSKTLEYRVELVDFDLEGSLCVMPVHNAVSVGSSIGTARFIKPWLYFV
jgi:hypothetical protein